MVNKIIIFLILLSFIKVNSQDKYITRTGLIEFESQKETFEPIKAKNNSGTVILNTENGEIASIVLIKAFRFKNALMEEHFNENYAESDKFPKASFTGKIQNFKLKEGKNQFLMNGKFTFHGITNEVKNIKVETNYSNERLNIKSNFILKVEDYDVKIPSIVSKKIAEQINCKIDFNLSKK